jgi:hypothetical protein
MHPPRKRTRCGAVARSQQRGTSSVVGTLAIVGTALVAGTAAVGAIGDSMQSTGAGIGKCIQTHVCSPGEIGDDPGQIASFKGSAGDAAGSPGSSDSFLTNVGKGIVGFGVDTATGLWQTVRHPIDTVNGVAFAVEHPVTAWNAIKSEWSSRSGGENTARAALEVATLIGPLAVTKLTKLGKVAEIARVAEEAARGSKTGEELAGAALGAKKAEEAASDADKLAMNCTGGVCTNGACFGPGTPVLTPSGEKPIEQIEDGDVVVARDPETAITSERRVVRRFITPDREVLDLGIESDDTGRIEHLTVTPEHPFWRTGTGWTGAGLLDVGDDVQTTSGHAHVVSMLTLRDRITVYNFEVETAHTYFVGATGAWVHNACTPPPGLKLTEVGLSRAAEQKRMDDIGQRAAKIDTRAASRVAHTNLPQTGATLAKGEEVTVDTYERVADAAMNHVGALEKEVNLGRIEQHVAALRAGEKIPPVEVAAGTPPTIVKGYESWVAGQMTGMQVETKVVTTAQASPTRYGIPTMWVLAGP